jgi:hypothetical protein
MPVFSQGKHKLSATFSMLLGATKNKLQNPYRAGNEGSKGDQKMVHLSAD